MENYIGEIRMFAGNYAPQDWFPCDGRALPINQYETLYTLLGTTYGGDGVTNFWLPDLRGRIPVHQGQGASLSPRVLGQHFGTETVTLTLANMPQHTHALNGVAATATVGTPGNTLMEATTPANQYAANISAPVAMAAASIVAATGTLPTVSIVQPFTAISYIIAATGIYPSQS